MALLILYLYLYYLEEFIDTNQQILIVVDSYI